MPIIMLDKPRNRGKSALRDTCRHFFTCRPKKAFFIILSFLGLLVIIYDYRASHRIMREVPDVLDRAIDQEHLATKRLSDALSTHRDESFADENARALDDQDYDYGSTSPAFDEDSEDTDWVEKSAPDNEESADQNEYVVYERDYIASFLRYDVGKARFKFLKEFQSPCWLENTTDEHPYSKNNMMQKENNYKKKGCFVEGLVKKSNATFVKLPNMDRPYRLRCLPYFMMLGFAKCGSSDFQFRSMKNKYLVKGFTKEYYWWDQFRFNANSSLSDYSDLFDSSLPALIKLQSGTEENSYYPGATGEMTTITLNSMSYWREDPRNAGLKEPKYLTPHDIYPIIPNVKLIVLMRNPVSRLYSHYNMWAPFRGFKVGPEDFHNRVVHSLKWWENCTRILPIRNCLYGPPPEVQPVEVLLSTWWQKEYNHSGEIRTGLYAMFLKDWLEVFPRKNFLFIRTEDYGADKIGTLNGQVYPFLNLPLATAEEKEGIINMKQVFKQTYLPMFNETKELLTQFYQPYNEKLAELLGDDKWLWKD